MKKPLFQKIAIVGVGLIGGSIGCAIRKRGLAKVVVGVVRRKATIDAAFKNKALHAATMDLREGVRDADLVILCAPVSTIVDQIRTLKKFISKNAIVIDAASSKEKIDDAARKYLKGVRFTGCHPMAGKAKTGVENADADLFQDALCFLTNSDPKVEAFWKALGCHVKYVTPKAHDAWVASMSHLPHSLAFALFQSSMTEKLSGLGLSATNPSVKTLARLSKSDPQLWADILMTNQKSVAAALKDMEKSLASLRKSLTANKKTAIEKFIRKANAVSQKLAPSE